MHITTQQWRGFNLQQFMLMIVVAALSACGGGGGSASDGGNTGGNNNGGTGGNTPLANYGQLAVTGSAAAQYAAVFTPNALQTISAGTSSNHVWTDANSNTLTLSGPNISATKGNLAWMSFSPTTTEMQIDAVAGSVTFSNLPVTASSGGATGALTLNGTLHIAPLNSGPIAITGADTAHSGSGFNAPAATHVLTNGVDVYSWTDARGTNMELSRTVADGSINLSFYGLGNRSFFTSGNTEAGLGITINTAAKTVTFSDTSVQSTLTGSSNILNGTLSLP